MQAISYARHHFPPEIIRHATWLYLRFTLSYRDVEELLAERGIQATYETVRRQGLHASGVPGRGVTGLQTATAAA